MPHGDRKHLRKIYILPNFFTAFNMFLGLVAIYNIYLAQNPAEAERLEKACWLLILAGVLDLFDGAVARWTKTTSSFGSQFDSLADLVSFGVAPSLAAFHLMQGMEGVFSRFLVVICAFYALCGALRLARYNVQAKGSERVGFVGLPIPAGMGAVVVPILFIQEYDLLGVHAAETLPFLPGLELGALVSAVFPAIVVFIALLMVSRVPYPHVKQLIRLRRHMSFETFVSLILVAVPIWALTRDERVTLLLVMGYTYILYNPSVAAYRLLRRKTSAKAVQAPDPEETRS